MPWIGSQLADNHLAQAVGVPVGEVGVTLGLFTTPFKPEFLTGYSHSRHRIIVVVGRRVHLAFFEEENVSENAVKDVTQKDRR